MIPFLATFIPATGAILAVGIGITVVLKERDRRRRLKGSARELARRRKNRNS